MSSDVSAREGTKIGGQYIHEILEKWTGQPATLDEIFGEHIDNDSNPGGKF